MPGASVAGMLLLLATAASPFVFFRSYQYINCNCMVNSLEAVRLVVFSGSARRYCAVHFEFWLRM
jgi:hypothetical protein